jgi:putative oxidoreductase
MSSASCARTAIAWTLQVLGALLFINFGFGKVAGTNAGAIDTFEQIGLGQWLRVVVGSLELLGAIGLLVPALAGLAGACLAALMVGAISVELFVVDDGSVTTPLICLVVVAAVAVLRRHTLTVPFAVVRDRLPGGPAGRAGRDISARS